MDFVNKAWTQLSDLFRSMTPGGRLIAGLLLAGVVISLGYLFRSEVSGPDDYLMNGAPIDPSCIPAMESAFGKANLTGFQIDGTRIRVPRGQQATYMAALAESKALPPNFGKYFTDALDNGNIFDSKEQRDQRMRIALQEELALIIRSMQGIERASVIISSETKPGLSSEIVKSASVAVKPLGTGQLDESRVSSIRQLIKGAVAGMKAENVTVADLNGRTYHAPSEGDQMGDENLYADIVQMHEREVKTKVLNALAFIPKVTVEATVVLNSERLTRTTSIDYKPKPVTTEVSDTSKSRTRETAGPGGRPGAQNQGANMPTSLATAAGHNPHEEEEESNHHESSQPSGERVEKENVGLTPKLVKVSVGIPSSYFEKVWQERNPGKEGEVAKVPDAAALELIRTEESAKLQKHVAALLPPVENVTDPGELVTITTFQDLKSPEIPLPPASQKALAWLGQYANTLGLAGLAVVSLLMLRSMVRSGARPTPSAEATIALRVAGDEEPAMVTESPEKVASRRLRRFSGSGPTLRDELSELVQEDPDAAANILRAWIGHAN